MSDDDREAADAATPSRRTKLALPLLLLLLGVPLGFAVGSLFKDEPPPPPPVVVPEPEPEPEPEPVPEPVVEPPPPPTPVHRTPKQPRPSPPSRPAAVGATVVIGAAVGGDAALRKQVERIVGGKLSSVTAPSQSATYSVTVNVERTSANADQVTVRCNASIAVMPKKLIVASLKSRADVAGEGTPTDELADDAGAACAKSLADDIRAWLRANPSPR